LLKAGEKFCFNTFSMRLVVAVEKEVGIPVWAAANADGEGDFGDA
jgi:hypothetical protein